MGRFVTQDELTAAGIGYSQNMTGIDFAKIQTLTENDYIKPTLSNIYQIATGWANDPDPIKKEVYRLAVSYGCLRFMVIATDVLGATSLTASGLKKFEDGNRTVPTESEKGIVHNTYDNQCSSAENELLLYLNKNAQVLGYKGNATRNRPTFGFSSVRGTSTNSKSF